MRIAKEIPFPLLIARPVILIDVILLAAWRCQHFLCHRFFYVLWLRHAVPAETVGSWMGHICGVWHLYMMIWDWVWALQLTISEKYSSVTWFAILIFPLGFIIIIIFLFKWNRYCSGSSELVSEAIWGVQKIALDVMTCRICDKDCAWVTLTTRKCTISSSTLTVQTPMHKPWDLLGRKSVRLRMHLWPAWWSAAVHHDVDALYEGTLFCVVQNETLSYGRLQVWLQWSVFLLYIDPPVVVHCPF